MVTAENIISERERSEVLVSAATHSPGDLPERMWFSLPDRFEGDVAADGDPFLPVLALVGMKHHAAISMPEVSTELRDGCTRIMEIYDAWSTELGDALRRVPIAAPTQPRPRTGQAAGAFFSGGVDSTYTLLRNHDRYPAGDARRIKYLLLGHGLDVSLDDQALFDRVLATARTVAEEHGVDLIPVRTNVRAFTVGIDWGRYAHGPCLAAIGHVLSPLLHTLYIASSYWFTTLKPWGSHPDIDGRWSSERLEFLHQGIEATRADKIRRIAGSEVALRNLRVCWRNPDQAFNCGRCEKCVRTMFALSCCGVLDRASAFPTRLDPELVSRLRLKPAEIPFWQDNLRLADGSAADPILVDSARQAVERGRLQHAESRKIASEEERVLDRLGLTPARLKGWDQRYLDSTVTRAVRAIRGRGRR